MVLDCGDGRSGGGVIRDVGVLVGVDILSATMGGAEALLLRLSHLPWAQIGEVGGVALTKDVIGDCC